MAKQVITAQNAVKWIGKFLKNHHDLTESFVKSVVVLNKNGIKELTKQSLQEAKEQGKLDKETKQIIEATQDAFFGLIETMEAQLLSGLKNIYNTEKEALDLLKKDIKETEKKGGKND